MTPYEQIEILIKHSPTIKILRGENATLIISFLLIQFKETNEQPIYHNILTQKLANYLDDLNYQDEEEINLNNLGLDSLDKAKKYIEQWADEEHRYLSIYTDDNSKEVMVVPTKYTSRMFQIIEILKERKFVGTESKFKDIFNKLRELIENSIDDPIKKIEKLEQQKKEIENEIRRIKREQTVSTFENYQIKSRFEDITKLTNELIGDFREVEDNFKIIVRSIIEKQADNSLSKGKLLQHTFDSLDELKTTDQGKSFYAFWNFLVDDASQDELKTLVDEVYNILKDREIEHNDRFLRKAKTILHSSGRKVWDSNNLLADKLTRIIAEKNLEERKKVKETINNIRQFALKIIDKQLSNDTFINIYSDAKINLPMERKLGEEQIYSEFNEQPKSAKNMLDLESLDILSNLRYINRKELLNNIENLLNERETITLGEVISIFPITKGLAEVLGYISLLQMNEKFMLNKEQTEYLKFDFENEKYLRVPQIIFCK
ncbi:MAG: DUF3375 domain-containing protein [Prevotellaceae bacterium]|jgi:uncharacterized protein (UPF0335 family)|nr:DUF3375 domain-containing protein [Prevotellaceae bacterium]